MWTLELKKRPTDLGRQLGYKVRGAEPDRRDYFEIGWLWDLTWIEMREDQRSLASVPLIIESEWNPNFDDEILWWDFQKLLVGRAALRVLVFGSAETDKCFDRLTEATREYIGSQAGDRYLFAAWDYSANVPRFRSYCAPG